MDSRRYDSHEMDRIDTDTAQTFEIRFILYCRLTGGRSVSWTQGLVMVTSLGLDNTGLFDLRARSAMMADTDRFIGPFRAYVFCIKYR